MDKCKFYEREITPTDKFSNPKFVWYLSGCREHVASKDVKDSFLYTVGRPFEFNYCPYCGKEIEIVKSET